MNRRTPGFSPIELAVVVALLAIAAGVVGPRVSSEMAAARDGRRIADLQRVREAIERYHDDTGRYPEPSRNPSFGGWDVSLDGDFVHALSEEGYLPADLVDPVNDRTYHYRYYVYEAGAYGCSGGEPFYVLGVKQFESPEVAERNRGSFQCSSRDWGREFAYVIGGGAGMR